MIVTKPDQLPPVKMEIVTDPEELAKGRKRYEQFRRNLDWLKEHASEVYVQNRGKHICIAGCELFVADSATEALRIGRAAHPEDEGAFVRYISPENRIWNYADRR
jgi:hypothetical protein